MGMGSEAFSEGDQEEPLCTFLFPSMLPAGAELKARCTADTQVTPAESENLS